MTSETSSLHNNDTKEPSKSIEFDYETTRSEYMKLTYQLPLPQQRVQYLSNNRFKKIVKFLLTCEQNQKNNKPCPKNVTHVCYGDSFALYRENERIYLINSKQDPDRRILKYLTVEDSFDVLLKIHLEHDHCGANILTRIVKLNYELNAIYMNIFVKSCNVCQSLLMSGNGVLNNVTTLKPRWFMIDLVLQEPDGEFNYVFVCKEIYSSYYFIRPLVKACPKEVATELLKIVLSFGSPLFSLGTMRKSVNFDRQVLNAMKELGLQHEGSIEILADIDYSAFFQPSTVPMAQWLAKTGTSNWAISCHIIQWIVNNRPIGRFHERWNTPYYSMFNSHPQTLPNIQRSDNVGDANMDSDSDCD